MDGILLCNKPSGITSNKIARNVSKKFNIKVGNTGILDMSAEGLLVLLIGKATRFTQFFQNLDKEYIAIGELGKETDTCDRNGKIIKQTDVNIDKNKLYEIIKSFEGKYNMIPPKYSSKKINGKRAYKYALKGKEIELKPVVVDIYNIEIININLPFFEIKVNCSSGTYIRSLIKDIGIKSQSFAYMYSLLRTKVGEFSIEQSIKYEEILSLPQLELTKNLIPLEKSLYFFDKIIIDENKVKMFKNGQKMSYRSSINNSLVKVLNEKNEFIGLGLIENNTVYPKIVL